MNEVENADCTSCIRYARTPQWGHIMCSAHRPYCTSTQAWEPNRCNTCIYQSGVMELMSIENQRECFESLNQMLKRTQHSKSITNPAVVWQYENIASVFMRGIILTSPRIETPAYIGYTPQRRTPINSIHNTPIPERGTGYQSSYTPHSIVGDVSRMSVGAAMNHQTRNTIDSRGGW